MRVVGINICYGDVTSDQVDPYVTGYPRRMVINPDRGEVRRIWNVRRVSPLANA
jgi:hypothetical protein